MMKRLLPVLMILLALCLAAPVVSPALDTARAEDTAKEYRGPQPMYVNELELKVYADPDLEAKVLKKLRGADAVTIELVTEDGKWFGILVEDLVRGGQTMGWIEAESMTEYFPQSLCPHAWGAWVVESQPTCTETGYRWRLCDICGIRDEEITDKVKHQFGGWKVTKEATCTAKGERTRTCTVCGFEEKEEYLEDHTFGDWTVLRQPTCTEPGLRTHTCKVCNTEIQQKMDVLPHNYQFKIIVEATDHSAGTRAKVCTVCGHNGGEETFDPEGTLRRGDRSEDVYYLQQLLVDQGYLNVGGADGIFGGGTEKAVMKFQQDQGLTADGVAWPQTRKRLDHDFGPWRTVKQMTRLEAGERMRVCNDCGYLQYETIEPDIWYETGRRGEDIRALQQIITEAGFGAGAFDGVYGRKLDSALGAFAASRGMMVQVGVIRPTDVDAVMNAWLDTIPDDAWMGEGDFDSPVNLALSVTPVGEPDDSGLTTYSWSLTNLGSEKAMFTALLLTYGGDGFKKDDLVMVLDGKELKAGAGNSISGRFTADSDWGEGSMHFAALALAGSDGAKWLSNTVTFGAEETAEAAVIAPQDSLDVSRLEDGVYPVAFDRGDVFAGASGVFMNAVHVYTVDVYDIVDVNTMEAGDTLVVAGVPMTVESIDRDDYLVINGGPDEGGVYLASREDVNGYMVVGDDDYPTYTEQGVTALALDPAATFTDAWDIDAEPVTVACDGIVEAMQASAFDYFSEYNTTIRVENGKVVEITRSYMP